MPTVWGLTGNIACGKSAVERMLTDRGIPVIDLDVVAREVVEPGEPALADIVVAFGEGVLGADGRLDRAALGKVVFDDSDARGRLQQITWPRIFERTAERIAGLGADGHDAVVVSAALMVESGSYRSYAGLAVVTCPDALQLERLLARDGTSADEATKRIRAQLPQADKVAVADFVIDNGGSLEQTAAQVDDLAHQIRRGVP